MSLPIVNEILKEYEALRNNSIIQLDARKNEVYNKIPKLKEIDEELRKLSLDITKTIINKTDQAQKLIDELQQKSIDLKIVKGELLATHNYPTDYLTIKYKCDICKDTGFNGNQKCNCFKQKLINYAYKQSNLYNVLTHENFDTFNFEYYSNVTDKEKGFSPKKNMQNIYKICLNFANNFDKINENLLFTGPTGLGKTFLSSCIAKELLDKGKTVFYQTAFKIIDILEEYKFSKDKDSFNKEKVNLLFNVDLLIIDDLGTEFINSYTSSEFFNILNSRLLEKKKTIISTNLDSKQLLDLYSERVISRILGNYKVLRFFGEDIRIKQKISKKEAFS